MHSMTGYGEASGESSRYRIGVSIRAVNHRYLDLSLRLPEDHVGRQQEIESRLRARLERGRIELRLAIETLGDAHLRVRVKAAAVAQLRRELDELGREGLVDPRVTLSDLVRLPGVVELAGEPPEWRDEDGELLGRTVEAALDQLLAARRSEGGRLRQTIERRLSGLDELVGKLERRRPEVQRSLHEELRQRLAELLGEGPIDPQRVEQEAALLVERSDVREELDRLASHLEHFRELMEQEGTLGKRLDFLCQEILRELNTTGSKCRDARMTRWIVHGKLLCEQLREQIQNVE